MSTASAPAPRTPTKAVKVAETIPRKPTKPTKPTNPTNHVFVHSSLLPRIKTQGLVKEFVNAISKMVYQHLYDAGLIGSIMESVYATTDQKSRYEAAKSAMLTVDYSGDFTLDLIFRMMNIREYVDERMAMEIAGFLQLYLPQRTFTKTPITVNSVDADRNPVTKVLEVKLYYAYEADAIQWLIKAFFNRIDLINESHQKLGSTTTTYTVLDTLSIENPVIQTLFFGNDEAMNANNQITFQSEMMTVRFPTMFNIFTPANMAIGDFPSYVCAGIYTMYIERFASAFTYCS